MLFFGSGTLIAVRTDLASPLIATPRRFGDVQEVSLDIAFTEKELKGQKQINLDVARSAGKISGKAKTARFSGRMIADIFFGETLLSGSREMVDMEEQTIPGSSAYTITVTETPPIVDLGVLRASDLMPFTKVADGEVNATLEYSADDTTGIYTFDVTDKDVPVLISYLYTSTSGVKFEITNKNMGNAPTFAMFLQGTYNLNKINMYLYKCMSNKITMGMKMEDYMVPEFDFAVMDNGLYKIGKLSFSD